MKRLENRGLKIIVIPLILNFSCTAQNKFLNSTVHVGDKVYICTTMDHFIFVRNKDNKDLGPMKIPSGSDDLSSINFVNLNKLTSIFNTVFSKNQLKKLLPEKEITIQFTINDSGDILFLAFGLSKNTKIDPLQLSELEDMIKRA